MTDKLAAARAPGPVFIPYGSREVDVHHVRDCRKPGQHIGKLGRLLLVSALAKRGRQFANFFHQPHKRAINAPGSIFIQIHPPNERLKIIERDGSGWFSHSIHQN
jgi:hypothetical protein